MTDRRRPRIIVSPDGIQIPSIGDYAPTLAGGAERLRREMIRDALTYEVEIGEPWSSGRADDGETEPSPGTRRGRPPGRGKLTRITPTQFITIYAALAEEHELRGDTPPTQYEMADKLGELISDDISRSTVSRYCVTHWLPWPPA